MIGDLGSAHTAGDWNYRLSDTDQIEKAIAEAGVGEVAGCELNVTDAEVALLLWRQRPISSVVWIS